MSANKPVRLMILGTGGMAPRHAEGFAAKEGVEIVAACDIDQSLVDNFSDTYDIAHRFTDLDSALAWDQFDAVANVTPDHVHHSTTLKLLDAGKHVFCEKPLATNFRDAEEMTRRAAEAQRIAMVNLTYRNVSGLQRARQMVRNGEIGDVRHVEASYLQSWLTGHHWGDWRTESRWLWRLSREHGSNGVLGDIGIHILDFASYGAASEIAHMSCRLKTFHKAEGDRIGKYPLDVNDSFVMTVEFENGALGTIHASRFATGHADDLRLRLYGTKGGLELDYAVEVPGELRVSRLRACLGDNINTQTWEEIELAPVETNYQRFIRALQEGQTLEPSFAHAANLQRILDAALAMEDRKPGVSSMAEA